MIDPARCLVVVATDREAAPFRSAGLRTVVSGVGRVNAAVATTIAIQGLESTPFVIASGIAGSLPRPDARSIGDIVIGDRAIAADEGIRTPTDRARFKNWIDEDARDRLLKRYGLA